MSKEKPEGFTEGRIRSDKLLNGIKAMSKKNKKYYNNGINEIKCLEDEVPEGYVKGRLKIRKIRDYSNMSEETKAKIGAATKKAWESAEYRKRQTESHKNKPMSENAKNKLSKRLTGTKIVNKDGHEKRISADDVEKYLNEGWVLGFTKNHVASCG